MSKIFDELNERKLNKAFNLLKDGADDEYLEAVLFIQQELEDKNNRIKCLEEGK